MTSDSGNSHVIADNGVLTYNANGILTNAKSTETDLGGNDEVTLGEGDNLVIAGMASDTVNTANGEDIILSDNGEISFDANGVLMQVKSTSLELGGDDVINAGNGDNIVVAGFGSDEVTTGSDNDVIIGDNGQIDLVSGVIRSMQSTDSVDATAGNDNIKSALALTVSSQV